MFEPDGPLFHRMVDGEEGGAVASVDPSGGGDYPLDHVELRKHASKETLSKASSKNSVNEIGKS